MTFSLTRRRLLVSAFAVVAATGLTMSLLPTADAQEAKRKDPKSLVGQAAPDFSLKTLDNKDAKLADLKGKVVLVDFWATWCGPCVKALPHINELAGKKELTDKGLTVLAVNVREKPPVVEKFVKSKEWNNLVIPMDTDGATLQAYHVQGIPTTVVIGRDGKVAEVFVGSGNDAGIDAAINKALAVKQESASK